MNKPTITMMLFVMAALLAAFVPAAFAADPMVATSVTATAIPAAVACTIPAEPTFTPTAPVTLVAAQEEPEVVGKDQVKCWECQVVNRRTVCGWHWYARKNMPPRCSQVQTQ